MQLEDARNQYYIALSFEMMDNQTFGPLIHHRQEDHKNTIQPDKLHDFIIFFHALFSFDHIAIDKLNRFQNLLIRNCFIDVSLSELFQENKLNRSVIHLFI